MSRILVVDDDPALRRALSISLSARGYELEVAHDGPGALDAAAHRQLDLVLLDLGLPGLDGVDVIRGVRGWSRVPIIVLSARHQGPAKVEALDAGADDYVIKPFAMDELLARIRAALRRASPAAEEAPRVESDGLVVDLADRRVWRTSAVSESLEEVHLTPKEWDVVALLVRHPGRLVSQRQLLEQIWGPQYVSESEYLRVLMARIRRKLEDNPSRPRHFVTEPGIGYRFEP